MVVVGYTELRDLLPAELELLTAEERRREFGATSRRRQYLCGRALLRLMLQEWTGQPGPSHELTAEEGGKPFCAGGPAISITHSGGQVACSIAADGLVGIDIESVDERREVAQIVQRFFSDAERDWLDAGSRDRFYMLWVLKEAFVKAHGQSIFGGLEKLRCTVEARRIDAMASEGGFRDLNLYRRERSFLGLATTSQSLDEVGFRRWRSGAEASEPGSDYDLIATTQIGEDKDAA